MTMKRITDDLVKALEPLRFAPPTAYVYNPLVYARPSWDEYCKRYAKKSCEVLFLGMNPGPFGMAQTGVPFGEVNLVRDWLGIEKKVGKPKKEHPKREIVGFDCPRSEVSGARLWGWARDRFGTADEFFARFFVFNYCPLVFMEDSGRNRIPEKLPKSEREPLFEACDKSLIRTVETLKPKMLIGVGKFAEDRFKKVIGEDAGYEIGRVLHPSPASPIANRGWAEQATKELEALGVL